MSENRLHKSANQRVRYRLPRFCLRDEQSPYEEWMIENLDDSDSSIDVSARNHQISISRQCVRVLGINSESAVVAFDCFISSVKGVGSRMRLESYTQFLSHDRTAQGADEKPRGVWIVFSVPGIGKPEHVSGELQDHVLKTTAGSQTRYEILASQADGLEGLR